jgi:L-amino acid N-acyltransferase YncA
MTGAPAIRPAGADDWPALWPIWQQVVVAADTFAYDPASTSEQARASWLARPPEETWLSERAGQVLGTYRLGANHAGPAAHVGTASYMVALDSRSRGVGRALVEHSIDRARELGFLGLQFNAVAATNTSALGLYESLGFETIGVVPRAFRHPDQGLVGLHVMYRDL